MSDEIMVRCVQGSGVEAAPEARRLWQLFCWVEAKVEGGQG
jgi:hypothetical protein